MQALLHASGCVVAVLSARAHIKSWGCIILPVPDLPVGSGNSSQNPQGKVGLPAMQMRNPMRMCSAYPVALHPSCLFRRPDNSPTSSPHHHCAGAQLLRCRFPATPDNIRRLSLQLFALMHSDSSKANNAANGEHKTSGWLLCTCIGCTETSPSARCLPVTSCGWHAC